MPATFEEPRDQALALEINAELQKILDVLSGKKIRNERGLSRQVRPDRFNYGFWL